MTKPLLTLMIAFLPILSSCSSKPPDAIVETIYVKQYIPLDLLRISCIEQPAGETVRSLAGSWVNNTSCLRAHQILVEGLIKNYTEEGIVHEQPSTK
ncbi:MAG: putative conjugative transfer protein [Caudoviricetes sp.]|nr:MAG: putative conjugative transfer protein [Caudoviricetes sp.]